ncbi:hypothetical protein ACSBR1_003425 [Camellia fascicularis]
MVDESADGRHQERGTEQSAVVGVNHGVRSCDIGAKTARELTVHIDQLANIFRYVNHPEAVADAIQKLWPIFKAIFDLCAWDLQTMESLCRACKNAVSLLNNDLCYIKLCEFVK